MTVLNRRSPYRNWRGDQAWGQNFTVNRASPQYDGLVAWLPPLGSRGSVLRDYVGSIRAAFPGGANNPTWVRNSQSGIWLRYDGGDYIDLGIEDIRGTGLFCQAGEAFSVSVWWAYEAATSGTLVGRAGVAAGARTFHIYHVNPNVSAILRGGAATQFGTAAVGQLHSATVTWDGSSAVGYFDGGNPTALAVGVAAEEAGQRIILGARTNGAGFFNTGPIGELRIYNRALSAGEAYKIDASPWDLILPTKRAFFMAIPAVPTGLIMPIIADRGIHSVIGGGQIVR